MSLFSLLVAIVYKLICIREKSELVFSENKNLNWMGLFESTANVCNIPKKVLSVLYTYFIFSIFYYSRQHFARNLDGNGISQKESNDLKNTFCIAR